MSGGHIEASWALIIERGLLSICWMLRLLCCLNLVLISIVLWSHLAGSMRVFRCTTACCTESRVAWDTYLNDRCHWSVVRLLRLLSFFDARSSWDLQSGSISHTWDEIKYLHISARYVDALLLQSPLAYRWHKGRGVTVRCCHFLTVRVKRLVTRVELH